MSNRRDFCFRTGPAPGRGLRNLLWASQWPPADPHPSTPKSASLASLRPQQRFRQGFSDAPGLFPPRDSLISAGCARSPPRASEHTRAAAAAASLAAQFAKSFPVPSTSQSLPLSRLSFPPHPPPPRSFLPFLLPRLPPSPQDKPSSSCRVGTALSSVPDRPSVLKMSGLVRGQ